MGKLERCADMGAVRVEIDALDRQIVALLADRLHYIDEAARLKQSRDQVRDEARIVAVLAKVAAEAERLGADPKVIAAAYRALIEASIGHEFEVFDRLKGRS